uniref:Uncharacterized protein n=1 Tax=Arundo donax TaxID=35708 RepID=A0A0A9AIP1_ARUDO
MTLSLSCLVRHTNELALRNGSTVATQPAQKHANSCHSSP